MQATTAASRRRARQWRLRPTNHRSRTLTYREVMRRAQVPGIYPRSPRGVWRAFRDLGRATAHPVLVDALMAVGGYGMGVVRPSTRESIAEDAGKLA
jgi:pyruvate carboxylase